MERRVASVLCRSHVLLQLLTFEAHQHKTSGHLKVAEVSRLGEPRHVALDDSRDLFQLDGLDLQAGVCQFFLAQESQGVFDTLLRSISAAQSAVRRPAPNGDVKPIAL